MSDIPSLLQPLKDRLAAATPGPWFAVRFYVGAGSDQTDPHTEIAKASFRPDAEFIAHTPTDQAKLIAAVEAVAALHKPEKRWEPYAEAGYTFLTREQALEAAGEEDLGVVAMEAGPQFFEVCAECARVESEQLSETGEEWGYRESLWPCKTAEAITQALGDG